MTEEHICETCKKQPAEIELKTPAGTTSYVCTSPECMMAAGMCPSCHVPLEAKVDEKGKEVQSCPVCNYRG